MAPIHGVSGVERQQFRYQTLSAEQIERRIALFTGDRIETQRKVEIRQGETVALPAFDPAQKQHVMNLFQQATPEQRVALAEAGNQLVQGLAVHGEALVADGRPTKLPPSLEADVGNALEQYVVVRKEADANAAVSGLVEMAVTSAETDMYDFASQLQDNLDAKKNKREEIADFRDQLADADWDAVGEDGTIDFDIVGEDGEVKTVSMTKAQAEAHLENLETDLATLSDMTQMMQLQLQDAMNKQAQAIQTLSAIMKSIHDTAKAVIQNMRA